MFIKVHNQTCLSLKKWSQFQLNVCQLSQLVLLYTTPFYHWGYCQSYTLMWHTVSVTSYSTYLISFYVSELPELDSLYSSNSKAIHIPARGSRSKEVYKDRTSLLSKLSLGDCLKLNEVSEHASKMIKCYQASSKGSIEWENFHFAFWIWK